MLRPIDVACGECAAQPGEACSPDPPFDAAVGCHAKRLSSAVFINGVEQRTSADAGLTITHDQFQHALEEADLL